MHTWKRALMNGALIAGAYAAGRTAIALSRRFDFRNRLVVITGGSRGLGLVLARQLADKGAALVICARDDEELTEAAKDLLRRAQFVAAYACDLTKPSEIDRLFQRIRREIGSVDVLINNAGVIKVGPIDTMTSDDYAEAMALHFWAPLLCIQHVLPDMRRRGDGRIVNVSSVGGQISVPHLVPYCASKFALSGLSQGMRAELAKDGVYVTTICPGLTRTGSAYHASFKGHHRAEYAWFSISGALPPFSMNAERAARQILSACRYGRARVTLSLPAKLAVYFDALAPELMADLGSVVARVLPPAGGIGRAAREGSASESVLSPSVLTTLSDEAAARNNEMIDRPSEEVSI